MPAQLGTPIGRVQISIYQALKLQVNIEKKYLFIIINLVDVLKDVSAFLSVRLTSLKKLKLKCFQSKTSDLLSRKPILVTSIRILRKSP